jgi:malate dehydrogenase (oxaloacetate-decarboxylating)(NADP+)
MFIEAAKATADQVSDEQREKGLLFPPQSNILETEVTAAERITALVFERNLARVNKPKDINPWLRAMLYKPEYEDFRS